MDLIAEIKDAVREVVKEEIRALVKENSIKQRIWITASEAMSIMDCNAVTLWKRATQEKSLRTQKVSPKKTLYNKEDCIARWMDKNYRPPL